MPYLTANGGVSIYVAMIRILIILSIGILYRELLYLLNMLVFLSIIIIVA